MMFLMLMAFIAGVVTILSPCILPVMPVVLAGSVSGGKRRPWGVVVGFVGSFTIFTLTLTLITRLLGIPADWLRWIAAGVMVLFGLSLLSGGFTLLLERLASIGAGGVESPDVNRQDFRSGLFVGVSLGLVWTPCVGPILATVLSLALVGDVGISSFFIMLSYAVGTGIPMLAIMYGGRELINRQVWLKRNLENIRKAFGILVVLTGLAILLNFDRTVQLWALRTFPGWGAGLTSFEDIPVVKENLERLQRGKREDGIGRPMFEFQTEMIMAPDFTGGGPWLNSEPLSLATNLRGKVVLVDFWTYTCINCIRTIPYLEGWYEKYKDQGFVLVGVHSPEFEFEKSTGNVEKAISDLGITYPVVQDNEFIIWRAYNNRYWPAHYLINKDGKVVYMHFGEGKYIETEQEIVKALGAEVTVSGPEPTVPARAGQTPEIYLGFARASRYDVNLRENQTFSYSYSGQPSSDMVTLGGAWRSSGEYIEAAEDGAFLELNFRASLVHLVMSNGESGLPLEVEVSLDGKEITDSMVTKDMRERGVIVVDRSDKFDVVDLDATFERHVVRLRADKGVRMFAFTFGTL